MPRVAAVGQDRRGRRTRWRRLLSVWLAVWLAGVVLIVAVFSGWLLQLAGGCGASKNSAKHRYRLEFTCGSDAESLT
jgi:hypothetical protein